MKENLNLESMNLDLASVLPVCSVFPGGFNLVLGFLVFSFAK